VHHDHAQLLDALRARDVRGAIAAQKAHRDASVDAVIAAITAP
jgi:DNA-binding GntR family transcriptional regulator